jgi:hypothetical protein
MSLFNETNHRADMTTKVFKEAVLKLMALSQKQLIIFVDLYMIRLMIQENVIHQKVMLLIITRTKITSNLRSLENTSFRLYMI